jgi:hypothetical protein
MPQFALDFLPYAPYAVGSAVGGVVLLLMLRKKSQRKDSLNPDDLLKAADSTEIGDEGFSDRRGAVRREGAPTRVIVSSPAFKAKLESGWVLDRSTGGLRLALNRAVPPGSGLQVRAENAPDTIPWVNVLVRSCKNTGEHYEVGCAFETTPPWNVLLLFG